MTDRDRLIELMSHKQQYGIATEEPPEALYTIENHQVADYLLANGVIVPPCHLNQTVWHITWNNRIEQCKVSSLTQKADSTFKIRITPPSKSVFEITPDEIGNTVFLTKEEAEEKLNEIKTKEQRK